MTLYDLVAARGATVVGTSVVVADCPPELAAELRITALVDAAELGA